jgi:hypothetical protein
MRYKKMEIKKENIEKEVILGKNMLLFYNFIKDNINNKEDIIKKNLEIFYNNYEGSRNNVNKNVLRRLKESNIIRSDKGIEILNLLENKFKKESSIKKFYLEI